MNTQQQDIIIMDGIDTKYIGKRPMEYEDILMIERKRKHGKHGIMGKAKSTAKLG